MSSSCYSIQTIVNHLKHCTKLKQLQSMYAVMVKTNSNQDCFLMNQYISALSTFNRIDYAVLAHTQMENPNVFVYNAMIKGSVQSNQPVHALELYVQMLRANVSPSSYTFPSLIKACGLVSQLRFAEAVHGHVWRNGFDSHLFVQTSLVDFYSTVVTGTDMTLKTIKLMLDIIVTDDSGSRIVLMVLKDEATKTRVIVMRKGVEKKSLVGFIVNLFRYASFFFLRHKLPAESPFTRMTQVIVSAVRKQKAPVPGDPKQLHELSLDEHIGSGKFRMARTRSLGLLDKASMENGSRSLWMLCSVNQVEETSKCLKCFQSRLLLPYLAPFWLQCTPYSSNRELSKTGASDPTLKFLQHASQLL
ncbi:hypothetical protein SADUNF_Sadunf02G0205100 [Salix dunnii]|uniref:Pentatricopeptide repeat-containing protein n=1 Tax=Salix dunnii TaxID=1413687 RepID=A0A835TI72_9ROSI|nr:hypothetical protein SADUNF_Sadunf02G0205100 [Salix dunnii]